MKKEVFYTCFVILMILLSSCVATQKQVNETKTPAEQGLNNKKSSIGQVLQKENSIAKAGSIPPLQGQELLDKNCSVATTSSSPDSQVKALKENLLLWIVFISGISGIFGGVVSFFMNWNKDQQSQNERVWFFLIKCIVVGLAASFIVPLFLNTISSNLIEECKEKSLESLILVGFCLIASIFSQKFIETVGKKIMDKLVGVEQEVKKTRGEVNNTRDTVIKISGAESEPKNYGIVQKFLMQNLEKKGISISTEEIDKVVQALRISEDNKFNKNKFRLRTIKGIAKETGISANLVLQSLEELEKQEIVTKVSNSKGELYWTLITS